MKESPPRQAAAAGVGRRLLAFFLLGLGFWFWAALDNAIMGRAAFLSTAALALWVTELVPLYIPTLLLWAGTPLLLGRMSPEFGWSSVLAWPAQPVMALFFGGFALGAAGHKHGIDAVISRWTADWARGDRARLLLAVMGSTAILSMWMSNVAAAAMMIVALKPLWRDLAPRDPFRRALLLGVAFGADYGGMATPVGSGPNALAMAASGITFLDWVLLGLPLSFLVLAAVFALLLWSCGVKGAYPMPRLTAPKPTPRAWGVAAIFTLTVGLWLSEPWHGVPPGAAALGATTALFASRLLHFKDAVDIDWSTLMLIAGGLTLGALIERSGLVAAAGGFNWAGLHPAATRIAVVFAAAFLSSVASNTATAAFMIPLAAQIDPSPAIPILVALGASLGAPFVISTPCNALVYGQGGLRARDFLVPGLAVMAGGTLLVALTGPAILRWFGIS